MSEIPTPPNVGQERKADINSRGQKRIEIENAVREGGDKEGSLLRKGFIRVLDSKPEPDDLRSPSAKDLGNLGKIYKGARESANRIKKGGEEAKLCTSINAIHEHLGLGKYIVETEKVEEDKVEGQRREKLLQDYEGLGELLADYYMRDYYEQKVEVSTGADKLEDEIPKIMSGANQTFVSRGRVREQACLYGLEAKKLSLIEDRLAVKIGESSVKAHLHIVRGERVGSSSENFLEIGNRLPEERDQLVKSAENGFLADSDHIATEDRDSFGNIDSEIKTKILIEIASSEIKIQHARKEFSRAIEAGNSERICEAASNIRSLQFKQKTEKSRMGVELGKQKAEDAWGRFKSVKRDLGKAIIDADPEGIRQLTSKIPEELKNALSGRAKSWYERFKGKLEPAIDGIREAGDKGKELVVKALDKVDEIVVRSISDFTEPVRNKFKEVGRWSREGKTRIKAEADKSRIETRKQYYIARHSLETWRKELSESSSVVVKDAKKQLEISLGELVGGAEVYEHSRKASKDLSKETGDELVEIAEERVRKLAKENPHFEKLNKLIDEHVIIIGASLAEKPEIREKSFGGAEAKSISSDRDGPESRSEQQEKLDRIRKGAVLIRAYKSRKGLTLLYYVLPSENGLRLTREQVGEDFAAISGKEVKEYREFKGNNAWIKVEDKILDEVRYEKGKGNTQTEIEINEISGKMESPDSDRSVDVSGGGNLKVKDTEEVVGQVPSVAPKAEKAEPAEERREGSIDLDVLWEAVRRAREKEGNAKSEEERSKAKEEIRDALRKYGVESSEKGLR